MNRNEVIEALGFDPAKIARNGFGTDWIGPTPLVRASYFAQAVDLATRESLKADRLREVLENVACGINSPSAPGYVKEAIRVIREALDHA